VFYKITYNLAIQVYKGLTQLASLFNKKAKQRTEGLRNNKRVLDQIIEEKSKSKNWQLAWFHAASLGEFEQARPVLEQFKQDYPTCKILVTFFSPSGFEIRKNYPLADFILYLPFDIQSDVEEFINIVQPIIVFWVKYEYWRNFLRTISKRNIPVYLFSAIFREGQPFFKWYGSSFVQPLRYFSHLFVQDSNSKHLLNSIGIQNVMVAGDTRFDRVADILKSVREIEIVKRFKGNRKLLVVGSAWEEDVACISSPIMRDVKVIIAPHELHEDQTERWKTQFKAVRYSEVKDGTDLSEFDTLIIDNIGLLSSIYQYADFAFIGGGFGKGLHNILEAATFGMPIFFGDKSYKKFKEATDLIQLKGAFVVENSADFQSKFKVQFQDNQSPAKITSDYVQSKTGATQVILKWIHKNTEQTFR
jgi:3-deoxy-D-manno-octulosonic-acid transferase